ncbi:MAG: hypothetical protein WD872_15185 [Pirellulaceae bacterium]
MKLRYLIWLLLPPLIGVVVYAAQSSDWGRRLAAGAVPILECPQAIDLGERELGEVALARFTIANRGDGELLIERIESNCACSGLEREQDGKFLRITSLRIAPREETGVVLRILVQGTPGDATRNGVVFHTNDPARPIAGVEATISRVKVGVSTLPTSVVFGTLFAASEARQVLDVYDSNVPPRTIDRVTVAVPGRVSAKLLPGKEPTAPARAELGALIGRIEVAALTNGAGPLRTDVEIHLAGERRAPTLIPVSGRVAGAVEVFPATLVLPRSSSTGPVYFAECFCQSTAGKPLSLAVDSLPADLVAEINPIAGKPYEQVLRIEWKPDREAPADSAARKLRLMAQVDGHDVAPVEITVICLRKGDL